MDKSLQSLPQYTSTNATPIPRRSSSFDFRAGAGVCPTCGGTGKVPKGQQEELVALIPYKDRRLKPRRTCLIVVIFVVVIVLMVISATLLAVFLSPRNVKFTCSKVFVANWTNIKPAVDEEDKDTTGEDVHMTLQVHGMAHNYNYGSIKMKNIQVTLTRNVITVGHTNTDDQVSINARQHKEIIILVNATYKGEDADRVRSVTHKDFMSNMAYTFIRDHACINLSLFDSHK